MNNKNSTELGVHHVAAACAYLATTACTRWRVATHRLFCTRGPRALKPRESRPDRALDHDRSTE